MSDNKRIAVRPASIALVGLAVVLLGVAALYVTMTADALPGFLPGHESGSATHHFKHGVAFVALAAAALAGAWFASAPDREPHD